MGSSAKQCLTVLPCGGLYNLTITSNTSVMEGYCCGSTERSGVDDRDELLSIEIGGINCNANPAFDLYISLKTQQ
ncbi:hypothetical protein ACU8KH_00483 [Lachancea thermotolerans]